MGLGMSIELFFNWQPIKSQIKLHLCDLQGPVEKIRQLCSRGAWRLNVPNRVALASSLAAAALDVLFDQPAGCSDAVPDLLRVLCCPCAKRVFQKPVRETSRKKGSSHDPQAR